jgi:hypothetical protein
MTDHPDWPQIRSQVAAAQQRRRTVQSRFWLISLAELTGHSRLPVFQELHPLGVLYESDLAVPDRIPLFISHRWPTDLMSLPRGRASFMMPMQLLAPLSSMVRQFHAMFSQLGLYNALQMVDTFEKIGITATSNRDIVHLIFLMESGLQNCPREFRVIL